MSAVEPHQFGLFAYSGAAMWAASFISLGYFLGERWQAVQKNVDRYLAGVAIALVILAAGYLVWRKWFRARHT